MRRKIATLLAGLSLFAVVPAAAQAQDDIYLDIYLRYTMPSSTVSVTLRGCDEPTTATSPGFVSPARLEPDNSGNTTGSTQVVRQWGTYTATAECAGRSYSGEVTVHGPGLNGWSVFPSLVEPGGEISSRLIKNHCTAQGPITSPGFTEPLHLHDQPRWSEGRTTVITRPGTYIATLRCAESPVPFTSEFTIKGTPRPKAPRIVIPPGAL
ncbi:hypothetical protein SK854_11870 [Lentzea sp. BCCO 10_0061]|uniref:Uncharacterized protein n=1 Tax=Lentzea sokolovensis TaxID=3095429 RepID=A0ABU4UTH9_9PSEU|nr:hypothetical protein [Lentzea sp. BCCO 10_0061]MDX8142813.1 hypothetical protein [Lentzea sp. BCCO 10_0061]